MGLNLALAIALHNIPEVYKPNNSLIYYISWFWNQSKCLFYIDLSSFRVLLWHFLFTLQHKGKNFLKGYHCLNFALLNKLVLSYNKSVPQHWRSRLSCFYSFEKKSESIVQKLLSLNKIRIIAQNVGFCTLDYPHVFSQGGWYIYQFWFNWWYSNAWLLSRVDLYM